MAASRPVVVAGVVLSVVVLLSWAWLLWGPGSGEGGDTDVPGEAGLRLVVYQSPWCGCCEKYKEYLVGHGFVVETVKRTDMDRVKRELGVPEEMWSCHTMLLDGYIVEGHVPVEAIMRLLDERPRVKGIAVPGMPPGVPGMEGPAGEVAVYWFDEAGGTGVFMVVDLGSAG